MLKSPDTPTPSSASLRGHFLIATPVIGSGFFNRSLTYICDHSDQGSMGIVVNQCLEIGLIDMLTHLDIEATAACPDPLILAGGPVATDHGFVLHRGAPSWEGSQPINDEVSLTGSRDVLCAIAAGEGPQEYLVALGYAGWAPGQLEAEMTENSWLTVQADLNVLFETSADDRLGAAGRQLGIDIDLLSAEAGHA
jgi:putative transcriptional regulator